jgi:hypothetical protein
MFLPVEESFQKKFFEKTFNSVALYCVVASKFYIEINIFNFYSGEDKRWTTIAQEKVVKFHLLPLFIINDKKER